MQLPCSFLGSKHIDRQADSGRHSVLRVRGEPYARKVASDHRFRSLPEPGLVFDALFKARDVSGPCSVRR